MVAALGVTAVVSVVTGVAWEVIAVISGVMAVVSVRTFTATVIMAGIISGDIMTTNPLMTTL
jgi:hypothetical protein